MNINDITITSLETINAFDIVTGAYKFTLDELQNATIAQTQERVDITGKQGRKLSSLKRNKAVTISGANGMISGGLLELQVGGEFTNKVTTVKWTDYLTVTGNAATTSYKAVGTTGNEVESVYIKNADGTLGTALTQEAFMQGFGSLGIVFVAVCLLFFAYSTILGWHFFGLINVKYLFGKKAAAVYSVLVCVFIVIGSALKVQLVWSLADFFNGLMVIPNALALLALSGLVAKLSRKLDHKE